MARQKYSGSKYMRAAQSFGNYQKSVFEAMGTAEIGGIKAKAIEDKSSRQQQLFSLVSEGISTIDKLQGIKETEGKVEKAVGRFEEQSGEKIDYSKVSLKDIIGGDAKLSDYGKQLYAKQKLQFFEGKVFYVLLEYPFPIYLFFFQYHNNHL